MEAPLTIFALKTYVTYRSLSHSLKYKKKYDYHTEVNIHAYIWNYRTFIWGLTDHSMLSTKKSFIPETVPHWRIQKGRKFGTLYFLYKVINLKKNLSILYRSTVSGVSLYSFELTSKKSTWSWWLSKTTSRMSTCIRFTFKSNIKHP